MSLDINYAWALSLDVASSIPVRKPKDDPYVQRVARQVFYTGAAESLYRYTRQQDFQFTTPRGAFGYWQQEPGNIADSLHKLRERPTLARTVADWYYGSDTAPQNWFERFPKEVLVWELAANPRLSCLFCRLAYLWDPFPVPESDPELMANYWRRVYNRNWRNDYRPNFINAVYHFNPSLGEKGKAESEIQA